MPAPGTTCVARYRRRVAASEERVWENVRDWEHLPWLHAASFRSIALEDEGDFGWRARIGLHPEGEIRLELAIEADAGRYVSRTLAGVGAGSEIWTHVAPADDGATDVDVAFWLPDVDPAQAASLGDAYVRLYTRLWDEDEAMMRRRASELARPLAPAAARDRRRLGRARELRERLPLCFEWAGAPWRLIDLDGALVAHAARCPHRYGPLDAARIEGGLVTCPWHGWRFDLPSGAALDGRRARLATPPRVEVAGGEVWIS